jgi:oligogalacturonide lyase
MRRLILYTFVLAALSTAEPLAPPKSWIDPDTGHRVYRLTDEPNSASLYFNQNGYSADGKKLIYTTPDGISTFDLTTHQTRKVVEGRARVIVTGHKTQNVYYIKGTPGGNDNAVWATDVDTLASKEIAKIPPHSSVATVNADETLLAGTVIDAEGGGYYGTERPAPPATGQTIALDQPRNKGQMMEQRLAAHLPMHMFIIDVRTGAQTTLLKSTDWLNHLEFSPTDPTLLMFCHEGPWHKVDRIWTIRTDGSNVTLIHKRRMAMEIAGHEFWAHDGKTIWYDLQTPRGQDFWVAGYNVENGSRTWYHLDRNEWSIHFNVTRDGTLFCGDGGDPGQVAKAPAGEWIYLFRPELVKSAGMLNEKDFVQPGVFRAEKLVNMSKHTYRLEPNVSFTPDQKWVVFRSNMFGPTYVFAVEVAPASDRPASSQLIK